MGKEFDLPYGGWYYKRKLCGGISMKLPKVLVKLAGKCAGLLSQTQEHHNPHKTVTPGMPELLRSAGAEGAVLLHNRCLPLPARQPYLSSDGYSWIGLPPATVPAVT